MIIYELRLLNDHRNGNGMWCENGEDRKKHGIYSMIPYCTIPFPNFKIPVSILYCTVQYLYDSYRYH